MQRAPIWSGLLFFGGGDRSGCHHARNIVCGLDPVNVLKFLACDRAHSFEPRARAFQMTFTTRPDRSVCV
jgi:hypothetical protein